MVKFKLNINYKKIEKEINIMNLKISKEFIEKKLTH